MSDRTKRWRIEGTLETRSFLHVGTGEEDIDRGTPTDTVAPDAFVATDHAGRPYLPGASLKGVLRETVTRLKDIATAERLFGVGPVPGGDSGGESGKVIVEDAFLVGGPPPPAADNRTNDRTWSLQRSTSVVTRCAIDPLTGAARRNHLFSVEAVPPAARFTVTIFARGLDDADIALVGEALAAFNADPHARDRLQPQPARLGHATRNGWGTMRWTPTGVGRLEPDLFRKAGPTVVARDAYVRGTSPTLPGALSKISFDRPILRLWLSLRFDGPFIVADSGRSGQRSRDPNAQLPDHFPRLTPDRRALLPAESFRGVLRSRVEHIARTLASRHTTGPSAADDLHTGPLLSVFGSTDLASRLHVIDFVGASPVPRELVRHERLAIDRFTGSVSGGKKFDVAVIESPTLAGHFEVDLSDFHTMRPALGLFALTLRDLVDGQCAFGLGAAAGSGSCRASIDAWAGAGWDRCPALANWIAETVSPPPNCADSYVNDPATAELDRWRPAAESLVIDARNRFMAIENTPAKEITV